MTRGRHRILVGDVRSQLALLPDASVHCCITSSPYWGLRDYGVSGQIGLEPTIEEYIETLVAVFREVHRVLRDDGTCWVNLGDAYSNDSKWGGKTGGKQQYNAGDVNGNGRSKRKTGLAPKNLCCIPWRVAIALQTDGWILRSAAPWIKKNALPESTEDRPSSAVEYVFMFAKQTKYFFDQQATRIPSGGWHNSQFHDGKLATTHPNIGKNRTSGNLRRKTADERGNPKSGTGNSVPWEGNSRNWRNSDFWFESVGMLLAGDEVVGFDVPTSGFPGAHFATFPEKLVVPMVLLGTSEHGCCGQCSAPWQRIMEAADDKGLAETNGKNGKVENPNDGHKRITSRVKAARDAGRDHDNPFAGGKRTTGWQLTCECKGGGDDLTPAVVLDPFAGSGTTMAVSVKLGRHAVGIELNETYVPLIEKRLEEADAERDHFEGHGTLFDPKSLLS